MSLSLASAPPASSRGFAPARRSGQPLERPLKIEFRLRIARGRGGPLGRLLLLSHNSAADEYTPVEAVYQATRAIESQ